MYETVEGILISDLTYLPQSGTATNNCKIIGISKLYKFPEHMLFRFYAVVSPPAALATVSDSGDSSTLFAGVLLSQPPLQDSIPL
jgi:hypothetical protein